MQYLARAKSAATAGPHTKSPETPEMGLPLSVMWVYFDYKIRLLEEISIWPQGSNRLRVRPTDYPAGSDLCSLQSTCRCG